jgi:hypothetical protein
LEAVAGAATAEEAFGRLQAWALNAATQMGEIFDVELGLESGGQEILRLLLQEHTRSRGTGDVGRAIEVVPKQPSSGDGSDEQGHRATPRLKLPPTRLAYRREHQCEYESAFGTIEINRLGYARPGRASVHPLDAELNLPRRRYSYVVQRRCSMLVARCPYDEALDILHDTAAARVPKRQLEQVVAEGGSDFERFYEERCRDMPEPHETGPILIAGVDCKGIPRRRTEEEKREPRPKRLGTGEKRTKKKMATVASVHTAYPYFRTAEQVVANLIDPDAPGSEADKEDKPKRPKPEHRRIWASVLQSKDDIIQQVAAEMDRRDPRREKVAVCLTDGEDALKSRAIKHIQGRFAKLILILDIIHVAEYLWGAAHVFYEVGTDEAREYVREKLLAILQGRVSQVVAGMRESATKLGYSENQRKNVDKACNYFLNNKGRMQYDLYLEQGLPIASGAVEGACGHLVKDRMERTGAIWDVFEAGADAVLKFRALDKSGDLHSYWDFHMGQERKRNYEQEEVRLAA